MIINNLFEKKNPHKPTSLKVDQNAVDACYSNLYFIDITSIPSL